MTAGVPILDARQVSKVFAGTVALDRVDFPIHAGVVHALIGENGAGKSTLMKILAGIEQPTGGSLAVDGSEITLPSPRAAGAHGIGLIHQELQLFPDLTVEENLFVGRERVTRWGTIDRDAQTRATTDVLARLRHPIAPAALVGDLPLGQQQIVEIARALVHDVRVLMMDEPTSALTLAEVPVLFQVIRDLTHHGVAVVYISHRLEELLAIADRVTVLRDGRVVGDARRAEVDVAWIVRRMTGRDATGDHHAASFTAPDALLSVTSLSLPPRRGRTELKDVTFEIGRGEVVGLYGLMGAGRTELLETVLGVHRDAAGAVRLGDRDLGALDVPDRVDAGVALVPEDRQAAGLVPTFTVRENLTLASIERLTTGGRLSPSRERSASAPWVDAFRIKTPAPLGLDSPIGTLSGGNQQKVVMARGAMRRPRVLLLDEPTRGVDVGAKPEILDAMRRLAADGMGILFATSDLADVQAAATRVLVMARGRITADLPAAAATPDALAAAAASAAGWKDGERAR